MFCSGTVRVNSLQECFQDHQQYHGAPHLNCVFCTEVLLLIPGFNFMKVTTESGGLFPALSRLVLSKAYEFGHNYTYFARKKSQSCEECGKKFKKASNRERHIRNVHYQQKHECSRCGKLFGRPDNLKIHMRVHGRRDKASTAGNDDSDSDNSSDDSSEESNEMAFDTFARNEEESDMEAGSDSSEDGNALAEEEHCGGSKATKVDSDEESSFPSEKNKDSDVVGGSDHDSHTSDDANVSKNDIEDSDSDSNLICKNCYQGFSCNFTLSRHEKKVKYSCEECHERFCLKSTLSAHMKAKHGRQGFQCSNCEQEFSTKQNLSRHVKNKSAQQCDQCSAVFCNAHALQGHVYSEHICKMCQICGNIYEYLNHHIEVNHGNSSTK